MAMLCELLLCRYTFCANSCGGSLERTRQTRPTVGAILVDSCVRCCVFLLKIPHVAYNYTQKNPNAREYRYDKMNAQS